MIEVLGLSKRYSSALVVDSVSFECPNGTVTGFLGPNGAGKSTTLRMISGLARPSAGTALINGSPYQELDNPGKTIGLVLDASAMHPARTGESVLRAAARLTGHNVDSHLDEILYKVDLEESALPKKVKDYSLGMRQKLALAVALVGQPQILILDEPTNGLDPQGILWIRSFLREFAAQGGTVLLSSHQLREISVIADRLVVISNGVIVQQGTTTQLLNGTTSVLARSDAPAQLAKLLADSNIESSFIDDDALVIAASRQTVARLALSAGLLITELRDVDEETSLEQLYLQLTTGARDD